MITIRFADGRMVSAALPSIIALFSRRSQTRHRHVQRWTGPEHDLAVSGNRLSDGIPAFSIQTLSFPMSPFRQNED
jgi:hypothetical protein